MPKKADEVRRLTLSSVFSASVLLAPLPASATIHLQEDRQRAKIPDMDGTSNLLPKSYEEWLALTLDQQDEVNHRWSHNTGEGRAIPTMAAARFMFSNPKVIDISVGISLADEYVLQPVVSNEDFPSVPRRPWREEDRFEGFRIHWSKYSYEFDPKDAAKLTGVWTTDESECDAEFTITVGESEIEVQVRRLFSDEILDVRVMHFDGMGLQIETIDRKSLNSVFHLICPLADDRLEDTISTPLVWRRKQA